MAVLQTPFPSPSNYLTWLEGQTIFWLSVLPLGISVALGEKGEEEVKVAACCYFQQKAEWGNSDGQLRCYEMQSQWIIVIIIIIIIIIIIALKSGFSSCLIKI
jgi:hypothetical protein